MTRRDEQVLKGTLDLMILQGLRAGPRHGYAVVKWIRETTEDVLSVDDGALYPALHRLEARGWISSQWGQSENNRKAKYYRLTARGRDQLDREISKWERVSHAVWKIIKASE